MDNYKIGLFMLRNFSMLDCNNTNHLPVFFENLKVEVNNLAYSIHQGNDLEMREFGLIIMNTLRQNTPSLEVLACLKKITQLTIEKDLYLGNSLFVINNLCKEIIARWPNYDSIDKLCPEILYKILSHLPATELENTRCVSKSWNEASSYNQIKAINQEKWNLDTLIPGVDALLAVKWLIKNPHFNILEYADLSNNDYFNNTCIELLTKNCMGLKHLIIKSTGIQGNALDNLKYTTLLETLNIGSCWLDLDKDALKNLAHTKNLRKLNISQCKFDGDALSNLSYTTQLKILNITGCCFKGDALKNLVYTKNLQKLNISCTELNENALENLKYTESLRELDISGTHLVNRALSNYLLYVKELKFLNIDAKFFDDDDINNLQKDYPGLNIGYDAS